MMEMPKNLRERDADGTGFERGQDAPGEPGFQGSSSEILLADDP